MNNDRINAILAEKLMGYENITLNTSFEEGCGIYDFTHKGRNCTGHLPDFTGDFNFTTELIEIIRSIDSGKYSIFDISWCENWEISYYNVSDDLDYFLAEDNDMRLAVCKAALKILKVPEYQSLF